MVTDLFWLNAPFDGLIRRLRNINNKVALDGLSASDVLYMGLSKYVTYKPTKNDKHRLLHLLLNAPWIVRWPQYPSHHRQIHHQKTHLVLPSSE